MKKGFTLIELLGTIVVLAIIALVTVPIILGIIEKARKAAFKDSVYGALQAAEYYYYEHPETLQLSVLDLNVKGGNFKEGIINLKDKKFEAVNITDGRYCGNTVDNEVVVSKGNCGYETGNGSITLALKEIGLNFLTVEVVHADFEEDFHSYRYKLTNSEGVTVQDWKESRDSSYTFKNLKQDTKYVAQVELKTEKLMDAVITADTKGYAKKKTITIEYPTYEGYTFEYMYSLDGKNYTKVDKSKIEIEIEENTTIYARVKDGNNNYDVTYKETKIDNEKPTIGEMEDITITEGGSYNLDDVEIKDNSNSYTTSKTINNTSTLKHGTYVVGYLVTDEAGNKATKTRNLVVKMKKDTSGASIPKITGKITPVTYDYGAESYVKADTKENWYNYSNKEWANGVIMVESPSKTYKVGDIIEEKDIESYFVWIPRYRYKLFNVSNTNLVNGKPTTSAAQEIEIEFEDKSVAISSGTKNGEWLTHPAFTTFDSNGMWVGKFETGYSGATSTAGAQVNSNDSSKVIIKPNVYSWRNITVGNIFLTSYNYERDLDSHMMKNTEWGAVAYLSHSKYGINTEVRINNNSAFITGYSAADGTNQSSYPGTSGTASNITLPYNTTTGVKASTTGNITGVYDMSGGAYEYVAGHISGKPGSSGLTPTNYDSKYFDVYNASSTESSYQYRILGDATGEVGPFQYYKDGDGSSRYHNSWYAGYSYFVDSSNPWFGRGGHYNVGVIAGQFSFARTTGGTSSGIGFRLVLTPQ